VNLAALGLAGLAVLEAGAALDRHAERTRQYQAAQRRAAELGRQLVVVGDPDAGMHTRMARAYGCGHVCVDLNGCPQCPMSVTADITKPPLPFESDSVVVFVACVLEYVSDVEVAYRELLRIAGDPRNLFVVTVQPWTFTAALYPGATWRGVAHRGRVTMTPVTGLRKLLYGGALGTLGFLAVHPLWAKPVEGELPPTPTPTPIPEPGA